MPTTKRKKVSTPKTSPVSSSIHETEYSRQPAMQGSNLLITLLVGVLAFSVGYLFSQVRGMKTTPTQVAAAPTGAAQPAEITVTMDQVKKLFKDQKMKFGNENSKVVFVEFSDPSCPFCHVAGGLNSEVATQANLAYKDTGGTYVPPVTEMRKLVDEGKAAYIQIYTNGHGAGIEGAQALYCANEKGKFWEAHDLLMSNAGYELLNNVVKNDVANAQQLTDFLAGAVDPTFMLDCLKTEKYKAQLSKDEEVAKAFGVSGTPHFLVNTTAFRGAYSYTDMESAVKAALGQ